MKLLKGEVKAYLLSESYVEHLRSVHALTGIGAAFFLTRLAPVIVFLAVGTAIEKVYGTSRSPERNTLPVNYACTFLFWLADFTVGGFLAAFFFAVISLIPGTGFIRFTSITDRGQLSLAVGLAVLFNLQLDFFYYWFHRLQHKSKWLWAEHELHHSDECMNVTTTWRHHWLEPPLQALFISAPAAVVFRAPTITIPLAYMMARFITYFVHLNARIELGRFSKVIAGPQLHRIHHSCLPEHIDKNFAAMLPLWDVLFGTYYQPKRGECPPTGLASRETPTSINDILFVPFRRKTHKPTTV